MLIKNTGEKIVNVGRDILMPGEEKRYPDELIGEGTLNVLMAMGYIRVSREKDSRPVQGVQVVEPGTIEAEPAAAVPEAKEAAAEKAPEKKPVRKSVRKAE